MSPETDTLDQLLAEDMPLQVIRRLYPDDASFANGIHGLLRNGDVRLLLDGIEVPRWRWGELFERDGASLEMPRLKLSLTEQGARHAS